MDDALFVLIVGCVMFVAGVMVGVIFAHSVLSDAQKIKDHVSEEADKLRGEFAARVRELAGKS